MSSPPTDAALPDGHLAFADCTDVSVAATLGGGHPGTITVLDLSHGTLTALPGLDHPQWTSLTTLVCDHNRVEGVAGWPAIAGLQTLSLNANRVDDLDALLSDVGERFPQLTYLSLLGNPCCPSEIHGGNAASYASYQRMVGKRLPQLHFLDFQRVKRDEQSHQHGQGRDHSPTPPRSAMDRIKSLGGRKSPRNSPARSQPGDPNSTKFPILQDMVHAITGTGSGECLPGPAERKFRLSSSVSDSDFGVDRVDDCPSKPPTHDCIIDITTAKLDAQLINQAEYDHIIAVMKSADVVDDDHGELLSPKKPNVKKNIKKVPKCKGFTFAEILATLEAAHAAERAEHAAVPAPVPAPTSPEDAENELLIARLAAADRLLAEETAELQLQERRAEIERRENALFPEPPMKSGIEDTGTTDRFSEEMKQRGLLHVTGDGSNVSLTFDQLPSELDLTQISQLVLTPPRQHHVTPVPPVTSSANADALPAANSENA